MIGMPQPTVTSLIVDASSAAQEMLRQADAAAILEYLGGITIDDVPDVDLSGYASLSGATFTGSVFGAGGAVEIGTYGGGYHFIRRVTGSAIDLAGSQSSLVRVTATGSEIYGSMFAIYCPVSLGSNALTCGALTASGLVTLGAGGIRFQTGVWWTDSATANRQIWMSGSTSYYVAGTSSGDLHVFRNANQADRLSVTNNGINVTGAITASGAMNIAPITKSALLLLTPTAASAGRWRVTDATPANREAYPDGTNWRYTSDDTVVT
jgi:hypothetical protein